MSITDSINSQSNISSDRYNDNGLILNDVHLPVESIQRILCYADEKTLLNCQQVCKLWNKTIHEYVWRRKAEIKAGCKFPPDDWKVFYFICTKNLFGMNLVKNHSGEKGFKHWNVLHNDIYYGGWGRFGGDDYADNDIFGGIDNYGMHIDGDCEVDSDSDYTNDDGSNNDDNNHADANEDEDEDDDIDIIFEDEKRSVGENSIETDNENTSSDDQDEIESASESENGNEILIENEDDNESSDNEIGYGNSCRGWIVECPPIGAPRLPEEPQFETKQNCFVTTYYDCYKEYVIDLIKEGFTGYILDQLQPPIEISEWYCGRWDCVSVYKLRVCLMHKSGRRMDEFSFNDVLQGVKQNVWHKVSNIFF